MRTLTLEEFQREGAAKSFRMVCPMCGNVATPDDFKRVGADPQRAAQQCIGRTMNPMPEPENGKKPCNWASFGLFRTMGKGMLVKMPEGDTVEVFEFVSEEP